MCVALPNHHFCALRKSINLSELDGEPFISLDEQNLPGRPALISILSEKAGILMDGTIKANGYKKAALAIKTKSKKFWQPV
ncbi:MAG TPA: hypothetical protein DCX10_04900 [Verrucomicrobiales bacterium]|nr:hypothetical protein [Verrucomicrobiales bacterium]